MARVSFPRIAARFAVLEARIAAKDLSLHKVEGIEERIIALTNDKTREFAMPLLSRLDDKRAGLVSRQVARLDSNRNPIAKLKQLESLMPHLSPEEVEGQFEAIEREVSLSSDKIRETVSKQLQHLRFAQSRPILHELDGTPHSFADQVRKIADAVRKTNSLAPLQQLNSIQLQEIRRVQ